jgi:hypothetical protein
MNGVTDLIMNGNLLVVGRLVDASNATLLANIEGTDPVIEVIYKPIFTTIQKPVLKIFMRNGDFRPYQVEWSADSNNVTNGCSSLQRLELLGNVKNLSFIIQCLNGNEVFRKDIPQSKGKKVILTYNDLPEGCEPVITHVISPDENLYSTRYVFKLLEGEYEHFSGSLHLDDCRD